MEFTTDALVLRSADYGENDRIVTLLTAKRGKLSAVMKGVKKAGARLNFASRPFCFAEYVLAEKGPRYTVTGASLYDGFFSLSEDIAALYGAACVTQAADILLYEGMAGGPLLVSAVHALGELSEGKGDAVVRFFLEALSLAGYPVTAGECPVCGAIPHGRMRFDMDRGAFTCDACSEGVPASETTYLAISSVLGGGSCAGDGCLRALRLLGAYFLVKTDSRPQSLGEYLRLLHPLH